MLKDVEIGAGGCSGSISRPRRLIPRFSLRRLLYASPLIGPRFARQLNQTSRNTKGIYEYFYPFLQ